MMVLKALVKRELGAYFSTPLAYIFLVIFLVLAGALTFFPGQFFERGQADLTPFFYFHPWLYLALVPAITMRLWAEERKAGTIELLMTLPVTLMQAVTAKFIAAWIFIGLALVLTFPIWITVNYLGQPDNGAILTSYLGSWLMAGGFLAIGACMSAVTNNQVVAFITTLVVCLLFVISGSSIVLNVFSNQVPSGFLDAVAALSFITHFRDISRGVLDLGHILYFVCAIVGWLLATSILISMKKAH